MDVNLEQQERAAFDLLIAGDRQGSINAFNALTVALNLPPEIAQLHQIYSYGLVGTGSPPLWQRRLRFVSMLEQAATTIPLSGDIAECGCAKGLSAFCISALFKLADPQFTGAGFHIFDSFLGLSEAAPQDYGTSSNPNMVQGKFAFSLEKVRRALSGFPGISFYPGWIPTRFAELSDRKFRMLNLDVDLYQPTRDAVLFFYPRLVPGGIIVCDDYNWDGAKLAINECAAMLGFEFEVTPFHQAVIRAPR